MKLLFSTITILLLSTHSFAGWLGSGIPVPDTTAPTLSSAALGTDGQTLTLVFDEAVTQGAGFAVGDLTIDATTQGAGLAFTLTGATGDGTSTHTYPLSTATVTTGETVTLDWAGTSNGLEDDAGNDLAAISGGAVTNNSEVAGGEVTLGLVTQGASGGNADGNATQWTASENFTALSVHFWSAASTGNMIFSVYSDNSNAPNALLRGSNAVAITTGEMCSDLTAGLSITASDVVWLAWKSSTSTGYYYDAGATLRYTNTATYPTLDDPFQGASTSTRTVSIWLSSDACP